MPGVSINLNRIENISARTKKGKIVITMETDIKPGDLAHLFNLDRCGSPIQAIIESPQAEFDLVFNEINTFTGELRNLSREPEPVEVEEA